LKFVGKAGEEQTTIRNILFFLLAFVVVCIIIKICRHYNKQNENLSDSEKRERKRLRRMEVLMRVELIRRAEEEANRARTHASSNSSHSNVVDSVISSLQEQQEQRRTEMFANTLPCYGLQLAASEQSQQSQPRFLSSNPNEDLPPSYEECLGSR
jgi:hypothetical protein